MKRIAFILLSLLIVSQAIIAVKAYKAKADITLRYTSEGGTNASAVVWNPDKKLYYAVFAGNEDYPLEVFNADGDYFANNNAGIDVRGLWYNKKTKYLEGNSAGSIGLFSMNIDREGVPFDVNNFHKGQYQPDYQSVGTFNPQRKVIYYYYQGKIFVYKHKISKKKPKEIKLKNCPADFENINATSMIFTGRRGEEFGILDYQLKKVYLFNRKGEYTAYIKLPDSAITDDYFRFSFANNRIWLYDSESRSWTAYKFQ